MTYIQMFSHTSVRVFLNFLFKISSHRSLLVMDKANKCKMFLLIVLYHQNTIHRRRFPCRTETQGCSAPPAWFELTLLHVWALYMSVYVCFVDRCPPSATDCCCRRGDRQHGGMNKMWYCLVNERFKLQHIYISAAKFVHSPQDVEIAMDGCTTNSLLAQVIFTSEFVICMLTCWFHQWCRHCNVGRYHRSNGGKSFCNVIFLSCSVLVHRLFHTRRGFRQWLCNTRSGSLKALRSRRSHHMLYIVWQTALQHCSIIRRRLFTGALRSGLVGTTSC